MVFGLSTVKALMSTRKEGQLGRLVAIARQIEVPAMTSASFKRISFLDA